MSIRARILPPRKSRTLSRRRHIELIILFVTVSTSFIPKRFSVLLCTRLERKLHEISQQDVLQAGAEVAAYDNRALVSINTIDDLQNMLESSRRLVARRWKLYTNH